MNFYQNYKTTIMKAIKVKDCAGNIDYVKGNLMVNNSLVKVKVGNNPYKGFVSSMFFASYSEMQKWLKNNPEKIAVGKACHCSGLKMGNSGNNYVYPITYC